MRRLITLLILITAATIPARAQSTSDWQRLTQVAAGHRVEIVEMNLAKTIGEIVQVTSEAITLASGRGEKTIRREDVFRVSSRESSKRLRNTLIGLAIGGGAGLAVGAVMDHSYGPNEHIAKTFMTPIGMGIGAGVGATVASHETLYRAPKRKP